MECVLAEIIGDAKQQRVIDFQVLRMKYFPFGLSCLESLTFENKMLILTLSALRSKNWIFSTLRTFPGLQYICNELPSMISI